MPKRKTSKQENDDLRSAKQFLENLFLHPDKDKDSSKKRFPCRFCNQLTNRTYRNTSIKDNDINIVPAHQACIEEQKKKKTYNLCMIFK